MARQCLVCLSLHAPGLGEEVDQGIPTLFTPPGRAFVINPELQKYVRGMVDGRKMLDPQPPNVLQVVDTGFCLLGLSLLINGCPCLWPQLGAVVARASVA